MGAKEPSDSRMSVSAARHAVAQVVVVAVLGRNIVSRAFGWIKEWCWRRSNPADSLSVCALWPCLLDGF